MLHRSSRRLAIRQRLRSLLNTADITRTRRLAMERFEPRILLAADWRNPGQSLDVNDDLVVSPLDVVLSVDSLNTDQPRPLPARGSGGPPPFWDVSGDEQHTSLDALLIINALNIGAPLVAARLLNDTAALGGTNRDAITRNPRISGRAQAIAGVELVEASVDGGAFTSVSFNADGAFSFDPGLATNGSADGTHTVRLRARAAGGALSDELVLTFTLDATAPASVTLELDPLFDSAPLGDRITTLDTVTLAGETSPGAIVQLIGLGMTTTSDGQGRYAFTNVNLSPGVNAFTVQAHDVAGNVRSTSTNITRQAGADGTPPTILLSAPASNLRTNTNITITGQVTDNASGAESLLAQLDLNDVVEVPLSSTGHFSFTTSLPLTGAADGQHLVRFRATDAAGNLSPLVTFPWHLDTRQPTANSDAAGILSTRPMSITLDFSEPMGDATFLATSYALSITSGASAGQSVAIVSAAREADDLVRLDLAAPLANASYRLTLSSAVIDRAGNRATPAQFTFTVLQPTQIAELSPAAGEELVSTTRETIVRFDNTVDPATITSESFYLLANSERVPGTIRVSTTERFATFFYDEPLPASTAVRVMVNGNLIMGRDGMSVDADNDGTPGGIKQAEFRTLPLTLIPGTQVWGYIYDSYNKAPTEHLPITVPIGDPQFDPLAAGDKTIAFRRAEFFPGTGSSVSDPRLHPNKVSSFIDASMVYGSNDGVSHALRLIDGSGKLKTSDGDLLPVNNLETFPSGVLPNDNNGPIPADQLLVAGDVRSQENPVLAAIHTIFVREHNRKADEIKAGNPNWSDEEIYQAARRWVSGLIQHITYQEFLPAMVGSSVLPAYSGYQTNVNPGISPLFSTAAFRVGHTLQTNEIERLDASGQSLPGGPLSLRDVFFNPNPLKTDGVDPYLRGLVATSAQQVDLQVIDDLRNFLFGPPGAGGMDLAALNIQRGRDMGLPSYNQARRDMGLPAVASFGQITSNAAVASALEAVYGDVEQIDLWVGGLAEDHVPGGTVGTLFATIIKDQFRRSRDGDRFWYENGQFSASELAALRATSLADVLERNSGVVDLPSNIFTTGMVNAGPGVGGSAGQPVDSRAYDGYGNNVSSPRMGRAGEALVVNYTVGYGDGISTPGGASRPNPRAISNSLLAQPAMSSNSMGITQMFVTWGQFVDHDLSLTPSQSLQGTDIPVINATISLDALPNISATTDKFGYFALTSPQGLPAPDFFVHIDGSTAVNAPDGAAYATLGKPFHSVPGQSTQLNMAGTPFSIYLPPMAMSDLVALPPDQDVELGFGPAAQEQIRRMFSDDPDKAQMIIDTMQVTYPAGSAQDENGNPATLATIIPVDPSRLPAPLPFGAQPELVISIQAGTPNGFNVVGQSMQFDTPAPIRFPNIEDGVAGEHALIWSFDHSQGRWVVSGTATVSSDENSVVSDETAGVLQPGWHFLAFLSDLFGCSARNFISTREFSVLGGVTAALAPANAAIKSFLGELNQFSQSLRVAIDQLSQIDFDDFTINIDGVVFPDQERACSFIASMQLSAFSLRSQLVDLQNKLPQLERDVVSAQSTATKFIQDAEESICRDQVTKNVWSTETIRTICTDIAIAQQEIREITSILGQAELAITGIQSTIDNWISQIAALGIRLGCTVEAEGESQAESATELPDFFTDFESGINDSREITSILNQYLLDATTKVSTISARIESNSDIGIRAERIVDSHYDPLNGWYALEFDGQVFRGRLIKGVIADIGIPSQTEFTLTAYDPDRNRIATYSGVSSPSGMRTDIPVLEYLPIATFADSDGDGLVDVAEHAVGLRADREDTDGDGIDDFTSVRLGLGLLGGRGFPTGVIGSVTPSGEVRDVSFGALSIKAESGLAYLATGLYGLAIVDSSQFDQPIILGQLDLPGESQDIAVDPLSAIAIVAAGEGGLHFVDVSDPLMPKRTRTISVNAAQVELVDGIVYVAVDARIQGYDPVSGDLMSTLIVPNSSAIRGLTYEGSFLYAMDADRRLHVLEASRFRLEKRGEVQAPEGAGQIFAEGGVVYVAAINSYARGGFGTINVTAPANPPVISGSDILSPFVGPGTAIVSNGSALGLLVGLPNGQPFVQIMDLSDPSNTNDFLVRYNIPAAPHGVTIASGMGFIADGTGGLVVVNYVPFDNRGQAPVVTAMGPAGSSVQEGSFIPIRARVTDDVQVREVELLMDGRVVARDVSAPWDLRAVSPALASGATNVSFQVRATDTGGNVGLSELLSYTLTPDISPPELIDSTPSDEGAGFRVAAVTLRFDEPIDTTRISLAGFTLTNLGGNFLPGGGDDVAVPLDRVEALSPQRLVVYLREPLGEGRFRFVADGALIADVAGNQLDAALSFDFTSFDLDEQNSVAWISDSDGDWDSAGNWSSGQVPGPNDAVIIDRKTANPRITLSSGNVSVRSLVSREEFVMSGGSLTVTEPSEIQARFEIGAGSTLTANGRDALFLASGDTKIDGGSFFAANGGIISLLQADSYSQTDSGHTNIWRASGSGSLINLSNLTSIDMGPEHAVTLQIEALSGGRVALPNVTQISDTAANAARRTHVLADGVGSQIVLTSLTNFTQNTAWDGWRSSLTARSGGAINAPNLNTLRRVDVTLNGTGTLPISTWQHWNDGVATLSGGTYAFSSLVNADDTKLNATGGSLDLPLLTSLMAGQLSLAGGATATVPILSNIDGASLIVGGGVTLAAPSVTSYSQPVGANTAVLRASGTGSVLDLSGITDIDMGPAHAVTLQIEALSGGRVALPNVTQISDTAANAARRTHVLADGVGSQVVLTSLTNFTQNTAWDGWRSSLTARSGGAINAPNLNTLRRVDVTLNGTGTLPISTWQHWNDGVATLSGGTYAFSSLVNADDTKLNATGGSLDLPLLTSLVAGQLSIAGGATATVPLLSNIDGASLIVGGGVTLAAPSVTSYSQPVGANTAVLRASGTGTVLDLSGITDIDMGPAHAVTLQIEALSGGRVALPNVTQISDTAANAARRTHVLADGVGSQVILTSLLNFAQNSSWSGWNSTLTASNFGTVTLHTVQTVLSGVTTSETNNGVILGQFGLRAATDVGADLIGGFSSLDPASLLPLTNAAIAQWVLSGISTAAAARLSHARVSVIDLPLDYLGHTSTTTIYLDHNAAGHGWFVDATPWDDEEFDSDGRAIVGGEADGRIDLLTVLLHELGHMLGLEHDEAIDSLMHDSLAPSMRRRISPDIAEMLFSQT
jgi:hypothetical protein